mmetsp:Transcript_27396/g.87982  ORF Transcript_27396/g.87982 Transcript_27396/m.87982 type:complete len:209 (-) Transcript_27396:139-765(-)
MFGLVGSGTDVLDIGLLEIAKYRAPCPKPMPAEGRVLSFGSVTVLRHASRLRRRRCRISRRAARSGLELFLLGRRSRLGRRRSRHRLALCLPPHGLGLPRPHARSSMVLARRALLVALIGEPVEPARLLQQHWLERLRLPTRNQVGRVGGLARHNRAGLALAVYGATQPDGHILAAGRDEVVSWAARHRLLGKLPPLLGKASAPLELH